MSRFASLLRSLARPTVLTLVAGLSPPGVPRAEVPPVGTPSPYVERPASRDGIGRYYMGREIGRVMDHEAAPWLERASRIHEDQPDRVVAEMGLAPDAEVADVGAGTGYFTFRLAERVPEGRVYAVDIQPEMLEMIRRRVQARGIANVVPILASETDPGLAPASVDAVLLVDAYHEFSHPFEVMTAVVRALRPGGRLFLIEYRAEDPRVAVLPRHKLSEAQARREMAAVGLRWRETRAFLPSQHFLVFEKP
jgi:ubiquinone/menaquinone biosynthesis C-methylase UbiE